MLFPPVSLALAVCAIVIGLIALTISVIRRGLCQHVETTSGLNWIRVVEVARWFFQTLFIIVLVGALVPLQLVLFFAAIMLFFQIQIAFITAKRDSESLGVLMVQVHHGGGSIPDLLESYGRGNPTLAGAKARLIADALRRGADLLNACERMKLRLPTATRIVLVSAPNGSRFGAIQNTVADNDPTLVSKLAMLTTYLPILIVFMISVYAFLAHFIFPTFKAMFEEFDMRGPGVDMLDVLINWVLTPLEILAALMLSYALVVFALWIMGFDWAFRGLPIVGRIIRQSRRATLLDALAFSTGQQKSLPDAFRELRQATSFRGERNILQRCVTDIESGGATEKALSRLLNRSQVAWVVAAEKNQHLPDTLASLAETIRMRLRRYIEWSVAIVLPLAIVLCAIPVGLACYAVMRTLTDLITGLT